MPASLPLSTRSWKGIGARRISGSDDPEELIEANKANGWPVPQAHGQKKGFTVQRLYLWVLQLMGNYHREGTGRRLCSHDFRRAAFTRSRPRRIFTPSGRRPPST